jgi:hypothetical protein
VADIDECVPGRHAKILRCAVPRVVGKAGRIAEVTRVQDAPGASVRDSITVDVAGHGPVVVTPADVEIVART